MKLYNMHLNNIWRIALLIGSVEAPQKDRETRSLYSWRFNIVYVISKQPLNNILMSATNKYIQNTIGYIYVLALVPV